MLVDSLCINHFIVTLCAVDWLCYLIVALPCLSLVLWNIGKCVCADIKISTYKLCSRI